MRSRYGLDHQLTPARAMYHFLSGYTAKVAGTEKGVTEPQATFMIADFRTFGWVWPYSFLPA